MLNKFKIISVFFLFIVGVVVFSYDIAETQQIYVVMVAGNVHASPSGLTEGQPIQLGQQVEMGQNSFLILTSTYASNLSYQFGTPCQWYLIFHGPFSFYLSKGTFGYLLEPNLRPDNCQTGQDWRSTYNNILRYSSSSGAVMFYTGAKYDDAGEFPIHVQKSFNEHDAFLHAIRR